MRKIILIFTIILGASFFTTEAAAERHPDPEVCNNEFTDSTGKRDGANDWCTGGGNTSFSFCKDGKLYYFTCVDPGWYSGAMNCDEETSYWEDCVTCTPWDCSGTTGCRGGSCTQDKLPCPEEYECCFNEYSYLDKNCPPEEVCKKHKCRTLTSGSGTFEGAELELDWPDSPGGTSLNSESTLPDLIQYLYEWGIALGGLGVFIALIMAGVQYLSSFGNPTSMKDAMGRIQSAITGLLLLLASWLILNTINPELTTFKSISFDSQIPDVPALDSSELARMKDATYCDTAIIKTSYGEFPPLSEGGKIARTFAIGSIYSSKGQFDGKDSDCVGQLKFYKNDCSDEITGLPVTTNNITVDEDQVIRCIRFFR